MTKTGIQQVKDRAAFASITGYAYQFDRTLCRILDAAPSDEITVEGVEDVDVETEHGVNSEQCKYHPTTTFSLARIRNAVLAMLTSFCAGKEYEYRLYLHCVDGSAVPPTLTRQELAQCLTVTHRDARGTQHHDRNFPENDINRFLERFQMIAGEEHAKQKNHVQEKLRLVLKVTAEDVRDICYGNALTAVMELAMRPEIQDRRILSAGFVAALDVKKMIYARWHHDELGHEKYARALARSLKLRKCLLAERHQLIAMAVKSKNEVDAAAQVIGLVAKRGFGCGKLINALPWTVLIEADNEVYQAIKRRLLEMEVWYNDGYEDVAFTPSVFVRDAVRNRSKSDRITQVSYDVRIARIQTYMNHAKEIKAPDFILFSGVSPGAICHHSTTLKYENVGDGSLDLLTDILERILL